MRKNALDVNCDGTKSERSPEAVDSIGTKKSCWHWGLKAGTSFMRQSSGFSLQFCYFSKRLWIAHRKTKLFISPILKFKPNYLWIKLLIFPFHSVIITSCNHSRSKDQMETKEVKEVMEKIKNSKTIFSFFIRTKKQFFTGGPLGIVASSRKTSKWLDIDITFRMTNTSVSNEEKNNFSIA